MSSSINRGGKNDNRKCSIETYESLVDTDEPVSSVVRLPKTVAVPHTAGKHRSTPPPLPPKPIVTDTPPPAGSSAITSCPPPLPPKPAFARGPTIEHGAPPPLPPKPDGARGEKLMEGLGKGTDEFAPTRGMFFEPGVQNGGASILPALAPPSRPVPSVPTPDRKPRPGEDDSWVSYFHDEKSHIDAPFPSEPTTISDGDPKHSSLGKDGHDASTQSRSDRVANVDLPFPSPPYAAHQHCIASLFQRITVSNNKESDSIQRNLVLTLEGAEDSNIGALVMSRERCELPSVSPVFRMPPIAWRLYRSEEPGGEAWSVLQEYLTNVSLKSRGRNRALQLLTGYVVGACLESADAGITLLSEIVRRMRGAERSERDGSIFTLLINIGAHVSFVQRVSWSSVEEVILRVFSKVVEEMHGRQDDDVMWERALRCYLLLCKSSDNHPTDDISSKCLAALALHLGDMTHTDIDHVLITEGLCPRLQANRDERLSSACVDVKCLEDIGGIDTILTLYARTASVSARHRLFALIYDITVLQCLEDMKQEEISGLKDHIATLRSLLDAHEIADLFTHTFRVGPWPDFVMDTIRVLLFFPLSLNAADIIWGRDPIDQTSISQRGFLEDEERHPTSEPRGGAINHLSRTAGSRYVLSTKSLVKILDKKFCLRIFRQMERMATQHSGVLAHREMVHFAREWKILSEIEGHVQRFLFSRDAKLPAAVADILTKVYVAVVDITSGRSNKKSILHMAEMVIELFTMKAPYALKDPGLQDAVESVPQRFLRGKCSVSIDLLDQANPSIFTLLLLASQRKVPTRRLSECRQCLIELLGSRRDRVDLLKTFVSDYDPTVAYRASELVSKFSDTVLQPSTVASVNGDDD